MVASGVSGWLLTGGVVDVSEEGKFVSLPDTMAFKYFNFLQHLLGISGF
jgi:hypothetical protein